MYQIIYNQCKQHTQKTKIHQMMFLFRYAKQAPIKLKISNVSVVTQKKTAHHIIMSPEQVFQEMDN